MPEQLDWCAECNAPIYMERVAGACTCDAGKIKALTAHIRRNRTRPAHPRRGEPVLPRPLDDAALTMATARAIAADHPRPVVVGTPRHDQDLGQILMADARRELGIREEFEHFDRTVRAGLGVPEPVVRPANCPPAPPQDFNLEALWTDEEIEGTASPMATAGDIEFDGGEDIEFEQLPLRVGGEETRFRVDRGAPQREPFRANVEPGPQGGPMRQVGQARGYPILREQRFAGLGPGDRYWSSEPEYVGRMPEQSERQVAPKPAERPARRPTVYERLAHSFLDEDDD